MTLTFDQIVDELAHESFTEAERQRLRTDVEGLVMDGALVRTLAAADVSATRDFNAFLEKGPSDEEITRFLGERFPGFRGAVEETLQDLHDDILAVQAS